MKFNKFVENILAESNKDLYTEGMKNENNTPNDIVDHLMAAFDSYADINDMKVIFKGKGTFDGFKIPTKNEGFVFKLGNQNFQVNVIEL